MRKNIKRIISIIIIIAFPFGFVYYTQVRTDTCSIRLKGFYLEPENSLDVVFLGQSEMFYGYSPALAYEVAGYTSYNYAIPGNIPSMYKYEIKEIMSRQSPQCVFIDITPFSENSEWNEIREATFRKIIEGMPLSMNKINAIIETKGWNEAIDYLLPFVMYHGKMNNYNGLKDQLSMDLHGGSYLKGILATNYVRPTNEYKTDDDLLKKAEKADEDNMAALYELVEYLNCIKSKVIFCRFPHRIQTGEKLERIQKENYIINYLREKDYDFLDLNQVTKGLIDEKTDFCDNEHLNITGQKS